MKTTEQKTPDLSNISEDQLEAALKEKRAESKRLAEKARNTYESKRDAMCKDLIARAKHINIQLVEFKELTHDLMNLQHEKLQEYGGIRSTSKGGFSVTDSSGEYRVVRTRSTEPHWDERSEKATELISDFLRDTVKKKDVKVFDILMTFIQKNKEGKLEYDRVMNLLQHEDKYTDPRWVEGLHMIKESYSLTLRGFGYEFKVRDSKTKKWVTVGLSFPSI